MNIILEGCDGVGKTSIVNELKLLLPNHELIKCSAPKDYKSAKKEYKLLVKQLNNKINFILDRGLLGECVYAPIMRNYYPDYMRKLETKLNDNTFLFLITASHDIILKRFDGKFITKEQIPLIDLMFKNEFNKCNYKHKFILDSSILSAKELAEKIISIIK
jgi:thymidylate kinase